MSPPTSYLEEIETLKREIQIQKPNDKLQFCANYFLKRLEQERIKFLNGNQKEPAKILDKMSGDIMTERAVPGSTFPGRLSINPFDPDSRNKDIEDSSYHPVARAAEVDKQKPICDSISRSSEKLPVNGCFQSLPPVKMNISDGFPEHYGMGRRTSVSAESLNPTASSKNNWTPPFHQKTPDQIERLKKSITGNFLFSHLDDEQFSQVLGALVEKKIPVKDIKIISQGDQGDFFYIVESGSLNVYVNPTGSIESGSNGLGNKVAVLESGSSFGELALMYNAPRAATVISSTACNLWALDRITFRRILMDSTFQRRRLYEGFLEEVPILSTLTKYERSKIADALETQKFPVGTTIIKEGDVGEAFYLLESGEAEAFKNGSENPVNHYSKGDYFGELALLNNAPRAASVISKTEVKVATLGKEGFQRLLGPVESIMRRKKYNGLEEIDPLQQKC